MEKIPTILRRNEHTKKVVAELAVGERDLIRSIPTEKVDGTNVRLTVRSGQLMRVEARKNPTKDQKKAGITIPWYRDAWIEGESYQVDPGDKYLVEAALNTSLYNVPDGEWASEAVGPKIQGNPLALNERKVFLFSVPHVRAHVTYLDVPVFYPTGGGVDLGALQRWLDEASSFISPHSPIEGVVFWSPEGEPVGKIKRKDFGP